MHFCTAKYIRHFFCTNEFITRFMATNLKKKKTISPKTLSNITQGKLYSVNCFVFLFQPIFRIHVDPIINRFYVHNLIEINKCRLHSLSQNSYTTSITTEEKKELHEHTHSTNPIPHWSNFDTSEIQWTKCWFICTVFFIFLCLWFLCLSTFCIATFFLSSLQFVPDIVDYCC